MHSASETKAAFVASQRPPPPPPAPSSFPFGIGDPRVSHRNESGGRLPAPPAALSHPPHLSPPLHWAGRTSRSARRKWVRWLGSLGGASHGRFIINGCRFTSGRPGPPGTGAERANARRGGGRHTMFELPSLSGGGVSQWDCGRFFI